MMEITIQYTNIISYSRLLIMMVYGLHLAIKIACAELSEDYCQVALPLFRILKPHTSLTVGCVQLKYNKEGMVVWFQSIPSVNCMNIENDSALMF